MIYKPHLQQKVGEGLLVDTSTAALTESRLDPHTAIVGPKGSDCIIGLGFDPRRHARRSD